MAQTAGPDDSASHRDFLHPANIQELAEKDCDNEAEDEADESESELGNVGRKRRRNNAEVIRKPRLFWRTTQVIPRSENSDEEIQNSLNEIASSLYEQAGTAYPPGSLFLIINLRYLGFFRFVHEATNCFIFYSNASSHQGLSDSTFFTRLVGCGGWAAYRTKHDAIAVFTCPMQ
jgi:hypothetical protein